MGRLVPSEPRRLCEYGCNDYDHDGCYRIRAINSDTGELRERYACTSAAARLAAKLGLIFPPGMWRPEVGDAA